MKTTLIILPSGFPCSLQDCPPGHFIFNEQLCFKSEYNQSEVEAFNSGGEYLCISRDEIVTPVKAEWLEKGVSKK